MKKYLSVILLYPVLCFSQNDSFNFEQNVTGIIFSNQDTYLILEQGFIQIKNTDPYTEYYRQIYNDSTLINPNRVLNSQFDLNIIPFLNPNTKQRIIDFSEYQNIGMFIQFNDSGKYNLTPYANTIIDSLNVAKMP